MVVRLPVEAVEAVGLSRKLQRLSRTVRMARGSRGASGGALWSLEISPLGRTGPEGGQVSPVALSVTFT